MTGRAKRSKEFWHRVLPNFGRNPNPYYQGPRPAPNAGLDDAELIEALHETIHTNEEMMAADYAEAVDGAVAATLAGDVHEARRLTRVASLVMASIEEHNDLLSAIDTRGYQARDISNYRNFVNSIGLGEKEYVPVTHVDAEKYRFNKATLKEYEDTAAHVSQVARDVLTGNDENREIIADMVANYDEFVSRLHGYRGGHSRDSWIAYVDDLDRKADLAREEIAAQLDEMAEGNPMRPGMSPPASPLYSAHDYVRDDNLGGIDPETGRRRWIYLKDVPAVTGAAGASEAISETLQAIGSTPVAQGVDSVVGRINSAFERTAKGYMARTGLDTYGSMRITKRQRVGPLQLNFSMRGLSSVTFVAGPLRYRLWSQDFEPGVSSVNLPSMLSFRPRAVRKQR